MKCDFPNCGKEATVHLTEIVNGVITKLHLCEEHAKQKGAEMEQHFGIADLLQGLAEHAVTPTPATKTQKVKCPNCGMVYEDFKKIGRLGCAECYVVFKANLAPLLKRIHGATQHTGKSAPTVYASTPPPSKVSKSKVESKPSVDITALKTKLRRAIEGEAYEEAAQIRDQIRQAEKRERSA